MMWFIFVACACLCIGFASGWIAARRFPIVEDGLLQSTRVGPSCSLQPAARPVIGDNSWSGAVEQRQQRSHESWGVRSSPLMASAAEPPTLPRRYADEHQVSGDSLLERIYPLHASGVRWDSLSLSQQKVILVTGPQRSGTTWASCALASSLGYTLYDERHPLTSGNDTLVSLRRAFTYARAQPRGSVIQAPMATSILHELPLFPGFAVLFIARHCLDVFRSQNRVMPHRGGWTCVAGRTKELRKYRRRPELVPHFDERDMVCTIKQHAWQRYQKPLLEQRVRNAARRLPYQRDGVLDVPPLSATIDFASFHSHPLWHDEADRKNLSIKRTAGTHCAKLLRSSTPLRSQRRVQQWADLIAEAEAASKARRDRWD